MLPEFLFSSHYFSGNSPRSHPAWLPDSCEQNEVSKIRYFSGKLSAQKSVWHRFFFLYNYQKTRRNMKTPVVRFLHGFRSMVIFSPEIEAFRPISACCRPGGRETLAGRLLFWTSDQSGCKNVKPCSNLVEATLKTRLVFSMGTYPFDTLPRMDLLNTVH